MPHQDALTPRSSSTHDTTLQRPLLPVSQEVPRSERGDTADLNASATDTLVRGMKRAGLGLFGAASSTVCGAIVGHGVGLFEGVSEAGLRRLQGAAAQSVVAARGIEGMRAGAVSLGVLGLTAGLTGLRNSRVTSRMAAVVSAASGAVFSGTVLGYIGGAAGATICSATAQALGADTEAAALKGWDAGAMMGVSMGALLGAAGGGRALWK